MRQETTTPRLHITFRHPFNKHAPSFSKKRGKVNNAFVSLFNLLSSYPSYLSFLFSYPLFYHSSSSSSLRRFSSSSHSSSSDMVIPPKSSKGTGRSIYAFYAKNKGKIPFFDENRFKMFSFFALYTKIEVKCK